MNRNRLLPYRDRFGWICKIDRRGILDGGDTSANEFTILYSEAVVGKPSPMETSKKHRKLTSKQGQPLRHSDRASRFSEDWRFSRDQLYSRILALGINGCKMDLNQLFIQHLKDGTLVVDWHKLENSGYALRRRSPTLFEVWACYLRAFVCCGVPSFIIPFVYLILCFLDIENLFSSIHKQVQYRFLKPDWDQRNHIISTDFGARILPTPVSILSKIIYGKRLPIIAMQKWWADRAGEPPVHEWLQELYK